MDLAAHLRDRLAHTSLTPNERTRLRCQLAKELQERGDYEGARRAMEKLWRRIGERPDLEGLDEAAQAELLLRVGALTGWIGSAKQFEGAQETAKDLISESIRLFEARRDAEKVDECHLEIALCYWRQGSFDEARVMLHKASDRLAHKGGDLYKLALLYRAMIERSAKRYHDALRFQTKAAPLFDDSTNHALRAKFHNGFAITLDVLGTSEKREDFIDRALVEYTAASFHFEQAGHLRYSACVENNLAMLYLAIGRYSEAHEHLARARWILADLKDKVHLAQVNETRAKVLLAEGRDAAAEAVISAAVRTLEKGGEQGLLVEALTTQGVSLARTGHYVRARLTLQRAIVIAEQAGDKAAAGRAALTIIEELNGHAPPFELGTLYEQAAEVLAESQRGVSARLVECARIVVRSLRPTLKQAGEKYFGAPPTWEGFSLRNEVRRYERFLIACALKDADGLVTKAANLLGYKHHYSLIDLINNHHPTLLSVRSPVFHRRPRKVGITREKRDTPRRAEKRVRPVTVLHVEYHRVVAEAVKETLESEGWRVVTCGDGAAALNRLASGAHYGLLVFDDQPPHVNAVELVRFARRLPHRKSTPVIVLSYGEGESEALEAGADVFLRKPHETGELAATVMRLLSEGE